MHGVPSDGSFFSHDYKPSVRSTNWLTDPRFLVGVIVYLSGFISAESGLSQLCAICVDRTHPGAAEYKIPYGGGFRFVIFARRTWVS